MWAHTIGDTHQWASLSNLGFSGSHLEKYTGSTAMDLRLQRLRWASSNKKEAEKFFFFIYNSDFPCRLFAKQLMKGCDRQLPCEAFARAR